MIIATNLIGRYFFYCGMYSKGKRHSFNVTTALYTGYFIYGISLTGQTLTGCIHYYTPSSVHTILLLQLLIAYSHSINLPITVAVRVLYTIHTLLWTLYYILHNLYHKLDH
jgi:hypothetical protein